VTSVDHSTSRSGPPSASHVAEDEAEHGGMVALVRTVPTSCRPGSPTSSIGRTKSQRLRRTGRPLREWRNRHARARSRRLPGRRSARPLDLLNPTPGALPGSRHRSVRSGTGGRGRISRTSRSVRSRSPERGPPSRNAPPADSRRQGFTMPRAPESRPQSRVLGGVEGTGLTVLPCAAPRPQMRIWQARRHGHMPR